ncbi:TIGR04222 domain-containing membrane protein [Geobacter sp. DSM 9736]|uniref:TIGR04222 domain-containing membrane protein n=1 Tax=Geobacter sp. DSM 9736 TaxID=1277350 RepID=UPI000B509117|nr:TIGR04222 domain-containing membrane protein [Geobacter sp. DSM 9736]SNB44632.1 TIGR04222 domain-containing protein [Geobacter sp. DSM 9736]
MNEFLHIISGPQSLVIFPLLTACGIIAGRRILKRERPLPAPEAFPPETVAALRGDWQLVLKTALFRLWRQGIIEILQEERESRFRNRTSELRRAEGALPPAEGLEMAVWQFLEKPRSPEDFFSSRLSTHAEASLRQARAELEQWGLTKSDEERRRTWIVFAAVCAVVLGIGTLQFVAGIALDRPSARLFTMLPLSLLAISFFLKPTSPATPLGRRYLVDLRMHYGSQVEAERRNEASGIGPVYAYATFGTTVMAATLLYGPFFDAFPAASNDGCSGGDSDSGCGGDCGGGD